MRLCVIFFGLFGLYCIELLQSVGWYFSLSLKNFQPCFFNFFGVCFIYYYLYHYYYCYFTVTSLSSPTKNPVTFLLDYLILPNSHWGSIHFSSLPTPSPNPTACASVWIVFVVLSLCSLMVFSSGFSLLLYSSRAFFISVRLSVLTYIIAVWFFCVGSTYLLRLSLHSVYMCFLINP